MSELSATEILNKIETELWEIIRDMNSKIVNLLGRKSEKEKLEFFQERQKIFFDWIERVLMIQGMYSRRNELIRQGKTDFEEETSLFEELNFLRGGVVRKDWRISRGNKQHGKSRI
jgi:hypothetical protein